MNAPRLTDAQVSQALRAHLPERARAGLRERILEAAETTGQQRTLPSFLGALSDADPLNRRRSVLIAAALLVALALASAAAVGALRLLEPDPIERLSLEPPTDIQAFVQSSDDRMPELPPVAFTTLDSVDGKGRIYVDRSGAVRIERYASGDAAEPATSMVLSGNRFGRTVTVGPDTVWVEQDEAIGEDPRVYLSGLGRLGGGVDCESADNLDAVDNGTATTGWRYVGVEEVAGRPTHHVACQGDLWIDIETRLVMRSRAPLIDDSGQPIPGASRSFEVTEIEFAEQPAALFEFAPPQGVAPMSIEAYLDRCGPGQTAFLEGPACSGTPPPPEATPPPEPSPTPDVRSGPGDCTVPSRRGPNDPAGPLAWTQASLKEDWPAPVRSEPAGGASVQPMPPTYIDPSGDAGSDVLRCVDIRDLTVSEFGVGIDLVSDQPPSVDPTELWIAYGVVLDDDGDGVPDWRYGIDNVPRTGGDDDGQHRAWRTDLHTGRTERLRGPGGDTFFESGYPPDGSGWKTRWAGDAFFRFGQSGDVAGGGTRTSGIALDMPLYAWASVIQDGRVVATDYAPDAGWLLPSPRERQDDRSSASGGTYVLDDPFPLRLTMSVAEGWTVDGDGTRGDPNAGGVTRDEGRTGVLFVILGKPAENDDCEVYPIDPPPGPRVDDLVKYLAGHPLIDISVNSDVTLDGYPGKYLEYTKSAEGIQCSGTAQGGWPVANRQEDADENSRVWILDVDGVRLVIEMFSSPRASEGVTAELRQIVESLQIEP